ncbi:hypothetical protein EI998_09515 [Streptococcus suis]|uniref:Plasmid replication protein origin binding domain-containing protein n=1 Tax=Streptococcus suis TaxID=1307 RepID=A0A3R8R5Z0_STRSU|nr:hypothetical protein EI998_09515 [Streptococcus suis]
MTTSLVSYPTPIPERISGLTGAVRYLTHMDNPEKYQYDNTEIQVFGGFDLESCLALSTGDKRQALKEMLGFISDNNINMWIKGGKISFPRCKMKCNKKDMFV